MHSTIGHLINNNEIKVKICGGNNGLEAVVKLGFLNGAIEYAVDVGAFNNAFHLCSAASSEKLEEVLLYM